MSFTIVDEPGLAVLIKSLMADAILIYRWVASDHDPNPARSDTDFWTGEAWFNKLWPAESQGAGSDFFQFVNEWEGNTAADVFYQNFATFYTQLGNACLARRVMPTFGDFSVGTPPDANNVQSGEAARFKLLDSMFVFASMYKIPVNVHLYSPEGAGAFDMKPGEGFYTMRWEQIAVRYPLIQIIGGEGGNFGAGGRTFDPVKTPACMQQYADMLRFSPYFHQFLGVHWWGVVDGNVHRDWAADDITTILPWFFGWSVHGQT